MLAELHGSGEVGRSYERYVTALRQQRALKDEERIVKHSLKVLEQVAAYILTTAPNMASLPAFQQATAEIANKREQKQHLVSLTSNMLEFCSIYTLITHNSASRNFKIRKRIEARLSQG